MLCALATGGCFPQEPGTRLAHFEDLAPKVGQPAPAFHLTALDGTIVSLDDLVSKRPLVLQLGSHSCPVYRFRRHWMHSLAQDYGERVGFLLVYTQEAHPVGSHSPFVEREWNPWINKVSGVRVEQPATLEQRLALARTSQARLDLQLPIAVDDLDNSTWNAYGAAASPAFVIDPLGRIAARQVWVEPKEIRRVLDEMLGDGEP